MSTERRLVTDAEAALIREHVDRVRRLRPNDSEADDYLALLDTRAALIVALTLSLSGTYREQGDATAHDPATCESFSCQNARALLAALRGEP